MALLHRIKLLETAEKIITIQRDYGNRKERKNARFKYTLDTRGLDWFMEELHRRLGWEIQEARPFKFDHTGDVMVGLKGMMANGTTHYLSKMVVLKISKAIQLKTGLREIAKVHTGEFRLTAKPKPCYWQCFITE